MSREALIAIAVTLVRVIAFPAGTLAEQGETMLTSRADGSDGEPGNNFSFASALSGDGLSIAFSSEADNLTPAGTNGWEHVFVRDLLTHQNRLASRATGPAGDLGNGASSVGSISAGGQVVAFSSIATNLHEDDVDDDWDVYVRDLGADATLLVSRAGGPDGEKGDGESFDASVSASGDIVAFDSLATNLHPDDDDIFFDVFVRNLKTKETLLVSRASGFDGENSNGGARSPAISADGRYVAFASSATNLNDSDNDDTTDVFVRDLRTGQTILVSRASGVDGEKGDSGSHSPAISADGRFVAFVSTATNLHADDTDGIVDVFVRDLQMSQTHLVSRAEGAAGEKGNDRSEFPAISADGRFVAFMSVATNLHPDDADGGFTGRDVFLRDLRTHRTFLVSRASGSSGEKGNDRSDRAAVSASGRYVSFSSWATNLYPDDVNEVPDVFLRDVLGPPLVTPVGLEVDAENSKSDGNGVLEPGEMVEVAPVWRNDAAIPVSLSGTAFEFFGPSGATYELATGTADYGMLDPEQSSSCAETGMCYAVGVGVPLDRPATHWDATLGESVTDPNLASKVWALHIGDSFADVPRSSVFYTAIENLLHSSVTGGCTEGKYCPGAAIARSQMPVFMLRALMGPEYTAPACNEGEERVFDDVPASNLFCPWIEDLAGRGIVSGCGGDNYCPSDTVTRAQMAIFLLKTLEGPDYVPTECTDRFTDVPCTSIFADWIEDLAMREITGGCSETEYCPNDPVTRGQMASFITKTFGFTLYGP